MRPKAEITEHSHISDRGDGEMNEDVLGCNQFRAWVIDGGTDVPETVRPLEQMTGALWISLELSHALTVASPDMPVQKIISEFAAEVSRQIEHKASTERSVSPICSVAVVERYDSRVKVSQVGDVTVYIPSKGLLLCDERFGGNEAKGVVADKFRGRSSILERRRSYIAGRDGMWVVGDNVRVDEGIRETIVDCPLGTEVLIASDGFARAISPYGIFASWQDLYSVVLRLGLGEVLREIRRFEGNASENTDNYKKRDDVSAMHFRV